MADTEAHAQLWDLLQLLGMRPADPVAVAERLLLLHTGAAAAGGTDGCQCRPLDDQQVLQHLDFLQAHLQDLTARPTLWKSWQQAVQLRDSTGTLYRPQQMFFALDAKFEALQTDMHAAGMPFLNSMYTSGVAVHGSSSGGSSSTGSSSSSSKKTSSSKSASKQRQALLAALGVTDADADEVGLFILRLYMPATGTSVVGSGVPFKQHVAHMLFLHTNWNSLGVEVRDAVLQQMPLQMQLGCCRSHSTAAPAAVFNQPFAELVYLLPAGDSEEHSLLPTLQLGGALFLNEQYSSLSGVQAEGTEIQPGFEQWLHSHFGLAQLTPAAAVDFIIQGHMELGMTMSPSILKEDIIKAGVYAAQFVASGQLVDTGVLQQLRHALLLVQHPSHPADSCSSDKVGAGGAAGSKIHSGSSSSRSASQRIAAVPQPAASAPLYWPTEGVSWQLQQVLPLSQVDYIHPGYVECMQQLAEANGLPAKQLESFFTQHLGVLHRPVPGSQALQAAVESGDCWQALLLMLSDIWAGYSPEEQRALVEQVGALQVSRLQATLQS